mmetsp:Transcript_8550/g.38871  ORF Transcript_8550/g.38871 Transcript_8550/m.38871 type:complete len:467 (-) Transcript_8550:615-2015(-)
MTRCGYTSSPSTSSTSSVIPRRDLVRDKRSHLNDLLRLGRERVRARSRHARDGVHARRLLLRIIVAECQVCKFDTVGARRLDMDPPSFGRLRLLAGVELRRLGQHLLRGHGPTVLASPSPLPIGGPIALPLNRRQRLRRCRRLRGARFESFSFERLAHLDGGDRIGVLLAPVLAPVLAPSAPLLDRQPRRIRRCNLLDGRLDSFLLQSLDQLDGGDHIQPLLSHTVHVVEHILSSLYAILLSRDAEEALPEPRLPLGERRARRRRRWRDDVGGDGGSRGVSRCRRSHGRDRGHHGGRVDDTLSKSTRGVVRLPGRQLSEGRTSHQKGRVVRRENGTRVALDMQLFEHVDKRAAVLRVRVHLARVPQEQRRLHLRRLEHLRLPRDGERRVQSGRLVHELVGDRFPVCLHQLLPDFDLVVIEGWKAFELVEVECDGASIVDADGSTVAGVAFAADAEVREAVHVLHLE